MSSRGDGDVSHGGRGSRDVVEADAIGKRDDAEEGVRADRLERGDEGGADELEGLLGCGDVDEGDARGGGAERVARVHGEDLARHLELVLGARQLGERVPIGIATVAGSAVGELRRALDVPVRERAAEHADPTVALETAEAVDVPEALAAPRHHVRGLHPDVAGVRRRGERREGLNRDGEGETRALLHRRVLGNATSRQTHAPLAAGGGVLAGRLARRHGPPAPRAPRIYRGRRTRTRTMRCSARHDVSRKSDEGVTAPRHSAHDDPHPAYGLAALDVVMDDKVLDYGDALLRVRDVALLTGPRWLNDAVMAFAWEHKRRAEPRADVALVDATVTFLVANMPPSGVADVLRPLCAHEATTVLFQVRPSPPTAATA